jgi:nitroimidazol reductase NimA-like FMN-containing flavoprotein (pyridoxamine 5'-phosphate oxidase superfamily)
MEKEFIKRWLKEHQYCVIATSSNGKPWAATVNYAVDDHLNVYISTNPDSLKFKNLLDNPNVCLVIDSQTREGTLQVQGIAETLKPEKSGEPNLKIKPGLLIFKSKDNSGKTKVLELKL